jgi:hypothetical protein
VAETPVEVIIRARNESQAALTQAIGQLRALEAQTKATGAAAGPNLRGFRDALTALAPQAGAAAAQVESLARAGALLGSSGAALGGIAAGIGLIGAAAFAAAKSLADASEELDNLALSTGASVGDIQVLQELFSRAGIGADTARTALHKLNVAIGEGNPLLAKLGVTARDPTEALMQLSAAFATSSDAGLRAKVAQELLGRGGKDLLAVLDQLREAFPALNREMDATGQKMSPELVQRGRELDTMFEQLAGRWAGQMNRMKEASAKLVLGVAMGGPIFLQHALAVRKAQDEAQRGATAWDRYRALFFPVEDLLAKATVKQTELTAAQKAHTAAVQELVALFGMERAAAERVIDAEERLAKVRRKAALEKELFVREIPGIDVKADRPPQMGNAGFKFPLGGQRLGETAPGPGAMQKMLADWRAFVDEITSATRVLDDTLQGLASGLTSGLTQVFQGLLSAGQTFGSALVTIFRSAVDEILAQLARLIAFKLVKLLLSTINPAAALPGMGSPGFTYPLGGAMATPAPPGPMAAAPAGNTYNIYSYDARSVVQELVAPGGSLRRAHDRLAVHGAY